MAMEMGFPLVSRILSLWIFETMRFRQSAHLLPLSTPKFSFLSATVTRVRLADGADPPLVKAGHHQVQLDGPYNRNSDHISEIFYCMKVNSVRDQQKIDQIPEKTIYPMTI